MTDQLKPSATASETIEASLPFHSETYYRAEKLWNQYRQAQNDIMAKRSPLYAAEEEAYQAWVTKARRGDPNGEEWLKFKTLQAAKDAQFNQYIRYIELADEQFKLLMAELEAQLKASKYV